MMQNSRDINQLENIVLQLVNYSVRKHCFYDSLWTWRWIHCWYLLNDCTRPLCIS